MIEFRCPRCNATASAPETKAGSLGKCRNCGARITVPHPQPPVTFREVEEFETHLASEDPEPGPAVAVVGGQVADRPGRAAPSDSMSRYPNLIRYLAWVKTLVLVGLIVAILAGAVCLFVGAYVAATQDIPTGLAWVLMGLVTPLAGYMIYTFYNAAIELIRVVIDIEANTRETNNILRELNEQA